MLSTDWLYLNFGVLELVERIGMMGRSRTGLSAEPVGFELHTGLGVPVGSSQITVGQSRFDFCQKSCSG